MNSVETFNESRDALLKSPDFFNSQAYPKVIMTSKKITKDTIQFETLAKGLKTSITMNYRFLGFVDDVMLAKRKAVIVLTGTVKRSALGVTYNVQDDSGKNLLDPFEN